MAPTTFDRSAGQEVSADLHRAWPLAEIQVVPVEGARHPADRVEALREAVREGHVDAAVHDMRVLPLERAPDLAVLAISMRADPRDALVARGGRALQYVPEGARVGALEPRQAAQLLRRRGDLVALEMADDVSSALDRLDTGDLDAVVVRVVDMARLDLLDRVTEYFDTDQMIPAPGQAAVGLEGRRGVPRLGNWLAPAHDVDSAYAVLAERTCASRLGASSRSPIGVYAITDGSTMFIHGIAVTPDGTRAARLRWSGPTRDAEEVGETLAELLASVGARDILAGGDLPPSIRYAERRREILDELDDELPEA